MKSETTPPVLPSAGGTYRLDGAALTRVAEPTRAPAGKPKGARFVGGEKAEKADKPAKAKKRRSHTSAPTAADPTPAAGEPAASDPL